MYSAAQLRRSGVSQKNYSAINRENEDAGEKYPKK